MLFVNSDNDQYFPMPNNERIAARLERLYSLFGAGDQMDAMISVGGHGYRTDIRRAAYEFFNRHFKHDARRVTDADFGLNADGSPLIERKLVRVFPEDADFPADSINKKIDEQFVRLPAPTMPAAGKFEAWRDDLLRRLKQYSFTAWPVAAPAVYAPTLGSESRAEKEATEDGIEVHWRWLPGKSAGRWLVVLNPGEDLKAVPEWARAVVGEDSTLLLAPRGVGPSAWTRDKFPHPIERALATLGATADSGRVWDVMTVAGRYGTGWRATGRGQAGVIAVYAALYQTAIESVVAVEPPASHRPRTTGEAYGAAFLHVLRVLDIPEAMGCLAPRQLTLIGAQDAAFARTATIYNAAGVAQRFARK